MKSTMISDHTEISFILPGMLEFMTERGGGREERILQISTRLSNRYYTSVIAPFYQRIQRNKKLNEKLVIHNIFYPAMKEYPPKSYFAKIMTIVGSIFYISGVSLKLIQLRRAGTRAIVVSDVVVGLLPSIIASLLGIKVIWYEGNLFPWIRYQKSQSLGAVWGIHVFLARVLGSITKGIIANDGMVMRALKYYSVDNEITIARAGVDTTSFKPAISSRDDANYCVGFIGRLNDEKGGRQLLNLCRRMEKELPEIGVIILGEGKYSKSLQQLSNIRFIGPIKHQKISEMLAAVDALVTFQCTFGLGEVEALACAKPIIGGRIGEIPELILEEQIGILCDLTTKSYMSAISNLLNNRDLRTELSSNARRVAIENYDWAVITNTWKDVIVHA